MRDRAFVQVVDLGHRRLAHTRTDTEEGRYMLSAVPVGAAALRHCRGVVGLRRPRAGPWNGTPDQAGADWTDTPSAE